MYMCTVLLLPGGYPIAVNKCIKKNVSYIKFNTMYGHMNIIIQGILQGLA